MSTPASSRMTEVLLTGEAVVRRPQDTLNILCSRRCLPAPRWRAKLREILARAAPKATLAIVATVLIACGDATSPAPGSVTVRTPTTGADVPEMALRVTLGAATRSSGPNQTVVFDGVAPGTHQVQLAGLSDFVR